MAGVLVSLKLEPVDSCQMQKETGADYEDTDHDNDFVLLVCQPM